LQQREVPSSRNPYRIFHLIKSLGRGGAETLLSNGLQYANHERFEYGYGYFLPWKNAIVPSLQQEGAEVICFNSRRVPTILLSVPAVARFLKHWKADLLHCHLPVAGVVGRLAARLSGIPVVYTEHSVMEQYHPWTRRMNLLTWKMQDYVIAVSKQVSASIAANAGSRVPVQVVQNGIPVDRFIRSPEDAKRIRVELNIPENAVVVGTVAVFRPVKDLNGWLKAARIIKDQHKNAHFLMVGDGPLFKVIRSTATELGLDDAVHFVGLQQNVSPYFSAMDVYASSSQLEGLPLSLLEAMAMNLPVVATAVGGIPEAVKDDKTGFLVSPGDPAALAGKICILISNDRLRQEFGQAGRARIEESFSMKRMIEDLEQIYSTILQRKSLAG
jgi:Glycosyltransferase